MARRDLHVDVHLEDGSYWGQVRELPGCFASGATAADLIESSEEAVALYLAPLPGERAARFTPRLTGLDLSLTRERSLPTA